MKLTFLKVFGIPLVSRPARGGWIEIISSGVLPHIFSSRPARGGWIEIPVDPQEFIDFYVPPRTGRVD